MLINEIVFLSLAVLTSSKAGKVITAQVPSHTLPVYTFLSPAYYTHLDAIKIVQSSLLLPICQRHCQLPAKRHALWYSFCTNPRATIYMPAWLLSFIVIISKSATNCLKCSSRICYHYPINILFTHTSSTIVDSLRKRLKLLYLPTILSHIYIEYPCKLSSCNKW